jgi:putative glutamine amidotransferase
MLGVCRGLQVLNVAFGGSLYQDLSLSDLTLIQHVQKSRLSALSHTIDLVPDTKLKAIFGKHEIQTNSSHHQAIKRLALGFKVNARSKDGLIEGMEKDEDLFVLGVQWHPEMMIDKHPQMINLFRALVKAVEQYKEQAGERRK